MAKTNADRQCHLIGTSLFSMNNHSFDLYQNATGATMDNATGFLTITPDQYENMQSLYFQLTGTDVRIL